MRTEIATGFLFFMSQMELMIEQFTKYSVIASRDYSIKEYLEGRSTGKPLDQVQRKMRIVEMLNMQIATSGWNNQIILHLSDSKEVISTDYSVEYNQDYIDQTELKKMAAPGYGSLWSKADVLFPNEGIR